MMRGYDACDTAIDVSSLKVKSLDFKVHEFEVQDVVSSTLPAFVWGACFAKPKVTPSNVDLSLRKRLYHLPPELNHRMWSKLRAFAHKWAVENLTPLTHIKTFDEWIEETHYSEKRKKKLRKIHDEGCVNDVFEARVKCFVKDEFYGELKAPRMISSREDKAKVRLGPIFSSIEDVLYQLPCFVKRLTASQRIEKIQRLFGDRRVYVTDYSAFETHFYPKMMDAVEMQVYKVLLSNFPDALRLVRVIQGRNRLVSKYFHGRLDGVRMSGEMNTSVGNGISNYIFMNFACKEMGVCLRNIIVEGDDGLVELDGDLDPELFRSMGLEIKLAPTRPCEASFCGCVFDPVTSRNFGHPLDLLAKIGWAPKKALHYSARRRTELLVAKVYSAIAEFPGVPLIWKFCELTLKYYGRITYARAMKYQDYYRTVLCTLSDVVVEPDMRDREYFAHLTGLTCHDQIVIEQEFEATFPVCYSERLLATLPELWNHNWSEYVM